MADTGFLNISSASGLFWTAPTNAEAADDTYATQSCVTTPTATRNLNGTITHSIPAGWTVFGVEFRMEHFGASVSEIQVERIELDSDDPAGPWQILDPGSGAFLGTSEQADVYGSPTELGGLTQQQLTDVVHGANLKAFVRYKSQSAGTVVSLDVVQVKIYYELRVEGATTDTANVTDTFAATVFVVPLATPTGFVCSRAVGFLSASLSCDSVSGATSYDWLRYELRGGRIDHTTETVVNTPSPSYNWTGLDADTSYAFRVRAKSASKTSARAAPYFTPGRIQSLTS